ncbi:MAG: hypothetical protein ACRD3S_05535, partial [Terracidiphilus sp.]
WRILWALPDHWAVQQQGAQLTAGWLAALLALLFLASLLILIGGMLRSMIGPSEKRVRMIWGILLMFAWALLGTVAGVLLGAYHAPDSLQLLCWLLIPGLVIPFAAACAEWGVHLPWRRVLKTLANWRWWLAVAAAVIFGIALPVALLPNSSGAMAGTVNDAIILRTLVSAVLSFGTCVVLLAWFTVLLACSGRERRAPGEEAMQFVPHGSGPLRQDAVKLPLPESNNDADGNL